MKNKYNLMFWLYAATVLGCAFLSFNSQPMLAKEMIPILGGSPMLWNVCMVFFQALLVLGYFYSYLLNKIPSIKLQAIIHSFVLIVACLMLPLELKQSGLVPYESPVMWVINTLSASIGVHFFALTATSNIIMGWASASFSAEKKDNAFKLYAFSNVGSLSGLLLYPFIIEPLLTLAQQKAFWSNLYYFEAGLIISCAALLLKFATQQIAVIEQGEIAEKITIKRILTWGLLAFIPSGLFVATGTYIATDVATIPLLFVVPLAIYLLTFIVAFNGKEKNNKKLFHQQMAMVAFLIPMHTMHNFNNVIIFFNFFNLYFSCLACHSILAGMKPNSKQITIYYLIISIGGVFGGIFSTLIAPLIFDNMIEYPLLLALSLLVVYCMSGANATRLKLKINWQIAVLIIVGLLFIYKNTSSEDSLIYSERTFFGIHKVAYNSKYRKDESGNPIAATLLSHGTTLHGFQSRENANDYILSSYYAALRNNIELFIAKDDSTKKTAVIGLGSGNLASIAINYNAKVDFYEIDNSVERIARNPKYFTYLEKCGAKCKVIIGDGRLKIAEHDGKYDMIFLDIFSSDAIPIHTLTLEAFKIYFSKLTDDGLIFIHISNRNLDLKPVISSIAQYLNVHLRHILYKPSENEPLANISQWLVIAKNKDVIKQFEQFGWSDYQNHNGRKPWTDNFSSIIDAISYKKILGIAE